MYSQPDLGLVQFATVIGAVAEAAFCHAEAGGAAGAVLAVRVAQPANAKEIKRMYRIAGRKLVAIRLSAAPFR
jgi:hypothetical protein